MLKCGTEDDQYQRVSGRVMAPEHAEKELVEAVHHLPVCPAAQISHKSSILSSLSELLP
jgi:hypothetical protein